MIGHYHYEHKRSDAHGSLIGYDTGNLAASSVQEIQNRLAARFGLQDWEDWTCLADGTLQRTHPPNRNNPYRGTLTVRPIYVKTE